MSKNITTIEKSAIEYLCGLIRELSNVSEGIDDMSEHDKSIFLVHKSATKNGYNSFSYPVVES